MANPLVPSLVDSQLTVKQMVNYPTKINDVIAKIAAEQLVTDLFFSGSAGKVEGGGIHFTVLLKGSNFQTGDVELRAPGAEYPVVSGDLTTDLAVVADYGSKMQVLDEEQDRNDRLALSAKMTQAGNTLARKIDERAIAAIDAALAKHSIAGVTAASQWADVITVGPEANLTPNNERPPRDFAQANLLTRLDELGVGKLNALLLNPWQEFELTSVYGESLDGVLKAAGIDTVKTSTLVPRGTAYMVEKGKAGKLGFERPLNTEKYDDRATRSTWFQSFAVPAFAVNKPGAVRKITGIGTGA
ncbi:MULTISPECIES: major capsid protein [Actinomycetes]|uniref:major capsid protein n=1 Tax=Actinomycetes TaxID=1760 RepID=UPI0004BED1C2|nr:MULTISPECIES: major capsid protein [Actinomycetes]